MQSWRSFKCWAERGRQFFEAGRRIWPAGDLLLRAVGMATLVGLASACAWTEPPPTQVLAVRLLDADGGTISEGLCRAANDRGVWPFAAPGTVSLTRSQVPLDISCEAAGKTGFTRAYSQKQVWHPERLATVGGLHEMMDPLRYQPVDYPVNIDVVIGQIRGVQASPVSQVTSMGR